MVYQSNHEKNADQKVASREFERFNSYRNNRHYRLFDRAVYVFRRICTPIKRSIAFEVPAGSHEYRGLCDC